MDPPEVVNAFVDFVVINAPGGESRKSYGCEHVEGLEFEKGRAHGKSCEFVDEEKACGSSSPGVECLTADVLDLSLGGADDRVVRVVLVENSNLFVNSVCH